MSLPWRYSNAEDYVQGVIDQLRTNDPRMSVVKVGKYYLHGPPLDEGHIGRLFQETQHHQRIQELILCGIDIACGGQTAAALVQLLGSNGRQWKQVTWNDCQGDGMIAVLPPNLCIECIGACYTGTAL